MRKASAIYRLTPSVRPGRARLLGRAARAALGAHLAAALAASLASAQAPEPGLSIAEIRRGVRTGFSNAGWAYDRYADLPKLDAGKRMVVADIEGPGIIRHIHTTRHQPKDLFARGIVLEIWFDGAETPAVLCPLADFFGDGCNGEAQNFSSLFIECAPWSYNAYFPMPFRERARVILRNDTDRDAMNYSYVEWEPLPRWSPALGTFHATYRRKCFQLTPETRETFFEVRGAGHLLGRQWSVLTDEPLFRAFAFVMEGNNEVDIDGRERALDYLGTEDSFTFSWGFQERFAGLRAGMALVDPGRLGRLSIYRFHDPMPIRFERSLAWRVDWRNEKHFTSNPAWPKAVARRGCWVDYATVCYWYQDSPGGYEHEPLPPPEERRRTIARPAATEADLEKVLAALEVDPRLDEDFASEADAARALVLDAYPGTHPFWIDEPEPKGGHPGNPHPGRRGILAVHPRDPDAPCFVLRKVALPAAGRPKLRVAVSEDPYESPGKGDFALEIGIHDGERFSWGPAETVAAGAAPSPEGWRVLERDLSEFSGKTVGVVLKVSAGGPGGAWANEEAFFDEISVAVSETSSAGASSEAGWRAEGSHGVVAAGGREAVRAGVEILEAGGNAADAAVATILALAVTDYGSFAIGAECPFLIYLAKERRVRVLSGMGGAPLDPAAIAWYLERGIPTGRDLKSAAVPSAPSVLFEALRLFGTKSFEEVAAPALGLLDRGREAWHPRLAATLRKLIEAERRSAGAREEKLEAARDRLYEGDIADELEAWYVERGSFLRKVDLAAHATRVEDPVTVAYRGYTVAKCGPWTQGPYLSQTLRLLEGFPLREMGRLTADGIHVRVEALKLALADRDAYYGDPLFADVPLRELLSEEYAKVRRPLIDLRSASKEIRPGDPIGLRPLRGPGEIRPAPGGTTTCCVADRWGNVVAATPSGNPPYVEPPGGATGIGHATRLTSFNTSLGHPNCIAAGKRPRITLTPTIAYREGGPVIAVSVAGGDLQDQVTLSVLLEMIEFARRPDEAVTAPRFATGHHEDSFDPRPERSRAVVKLGGLTLASSIPKEVREALAARGHEVAVAEKPIGAPVAVLFDPETGIAYAAGDPAAGRHAGAAR